MTFSDLKNTLKLYKKSTITDKNVAKHIRNLAFRGF